MHYVYTGNIVMQAPRKLIGLLLLLGLTACGGANHPPLPAAPPGTPVQLAAPSAAAVALPVPAIGRLERADEATLSFLAAGVIERIEVDIGDRVRRGQVLARLSPTALDASVRQAEATLAQAQREVRRAQSLLDRQLVARQQLDDARTRADVAESAVKQARFVARYGQIVAAADGVVLARLAEPGEVVAAGTPVLKLSGQGGGWRLRATVADRDGVRLTVGDSARVQIAALSGVDWPARVERIGAEADRASGGVTVELALDVSDGAALAAAKSGLIGRAWIEASAAAGLAVPTSALVAVTEGRGRVFLAVDGRATLREVVLGEVGVDQVAVLQGLGAEDRVVIAGAAYLEEGELLRELPAAGAQP